MEPLEMSDQTLRDRYIELVEHVQEPYLSEERKRAISLEMARLSFEIEMRTQDA